ncbi:hypothetical protein ACI4CU_28610, partial [Klebsiella pneumoniae]|uniref:hypothetical protein n=1 Tax=Klebsiella pneumoniae TaxID=573 RepID=UPI0038530FF6
ASADTLALRAGAQPLSLTAWQGAAKAARAPALQAELGKVGYDAARVRPGLLGMIGVVAGRVLLMALSGATYGPVAAVLAE